MRFLIGLFLLFTTPVYATDLIPNFYEAVPDKIYRGGRPTENGLYYLKSKGIKTIINLQGSDARSPIYGDLIAWWQPGERPENIEAEKKLSLKLDIQYVLSPLNSFDKVTKEDDARIDRVLQLLHDPSSHPVFIHCEHGKDRTGLLIALYRVKYENWEIADAYQEWIEHGHGLLLLISSELDQYFFKKAAKVD